MKRISLFFCLLNGVFLSYAQEEPTLRFDFQRQNNLTYKMKWDMRWKNHRDKYRWDIYSHHDNLYNTARTPPFVQLYFHQDIWQFYDIHKKISLASWIEIDQFIHNKNQRYNIYKGVEYNPYPFLKITPLIGYSWDYLSSRLNQGFSPALKLSASHTFKDGTDMQSTLFLRAKYIYPRHQRNLSLRSQWRKPFESKGGIEASIGAGSNEIDNYKGNEIEKIQSDSISPALAVVYQFHKKLRFQSQNQVQISNRRFVYKPLSDFRPQSNNLSFSQIDFQTAQQLEWQMKHARILGMYSVDISERKYTIENNIGLNNLAFRELEANEHKKDFTRIQYSTSLSSSWDITDRHNWMLQLQNRYIQYDSPSELNVDDHDELNNSIETEWKAGWRKNFKMSYAIKGSTRQYAFLFKEKSQDNYTQYNLRAEVSHEWSPFPKFNWRGEHWIYVTYNVKDFRDITFSNRATRNLETRWDFQYNPSPKWQSIATFYRKESQVSYLNWEEFSETTLDTTRTFYLENKNGYRLFQREKSGTLWVDVGYKHFYLFRFQNTLMFNLANILTPINLHTRNFQTGPLTGMRWVHKRNSLEALIWWQYQQQDYRFHTLDKFPAFTANYRQEDLERVTIGFRPYWDIKLSIWF